MIQLGGPVFIEVEGKYIPSNQCDLAHYDPEYVAHKHKSLGYNAGYLPYIPVEEEELIRATKKAFDSQGILMAEMGYWENLQDKDPSIRKQNIEQMCRVLASADALGTICVVNTIGTNTFGSMSDNFNKGNFSQEVFETAVDNCRYILNTVKPTRTKFTYENFGFTALDSIDAIEQLYQSVDDKRLGVHLDAANLVTSVKDYFNFKALLDESFRRFGDKIVSTHIKDLWLMRPSVHVEIREVIPGTGELALDHYIRKINEMKVDIPGMMEHLPHESDYVQGKHHLKSLIEVL